MDRCMIIDLSSNVCLIIIGYIFNHTNHHYFLLLFFCDVVTGNQYIHCERIKYTLRSTTLKIIKYCDRFTPNGTGEI